MSNKFYKFADLPPNPFDPQDLKDYRELGANVCLLTEDDVDLVKDGKLSEDYKQAIRNIADAGLQVWIRNMYNDEEYFLCDYHKHGENYGDAYEMEPRNITDEFKEFPAVTGFYMADEAYMYTLPEKWEVGFMQDMQADKHIEKYASFDKLTKLVDWKNEHYPDAFFHMNHVPGQSWDHFAPRNGEIYDYEDFLTAYCDIILRRLKGCKRSLCLDNYPFIGEDYIEYDYLKDFMTAAKVWRAYNASVAEEDKAVLGFCVQTFHAKALFDDRHRDITMSEEVSLQIFTGMAVGARLFECFLYRSYRDEMIGIKGPDGQKRIFDIVQEGIRRTEPFEEVLSQFEAYGAFVVPGELRTENTKAFVQLKDLVVKEDALTVHPEYDAVIGCFTNGEQKGYMLVNYTDPIRKHTSKMTLQFADANSATIYLDNEVQTVALENGTCTITLTPGNAAFVVPEK